MTPFPVESKAYRPHAPGDRVIDVTMDGFIHTVLNCFYDDETGRWNTVLNDDSIRRARRLKVVGREYAVGQEAPKSGALKAKTAKKAG